MIRCVGLCASTLVLLVCSAFVAGPCSATEDFDVATRLAMVGDYQGALKEYERFLYDHPEDRLAPAAAMAAGNLYLESLDDPEAAVRKYDVVLIDYRSSSWAPEAAARKGTALQAMENWRPAAKAFELALDLDAEQGNVQSAQWTNNVVANAADCHHRLDDHQNVLATYRRALEGSPPPEVTATALFRMGEAYEAIDQPASAAARYAELLEKAPCASGQVLAQVMAKRGLIEQHTTLDLTPYVAYDESYQLLRQRDYEGALERCREGEMGTANPALLECFEGRRIYIETSVSGDFAVGLRAMTSYMEKYPQGQLTDLAGRIQAFWTNIVDAEAEVARNPENARFLSSLGELYYYAGSVAPAIETLERSQALNPDIALTHELLGAAYYYTDRLEDAVGQFDTLLEMGGDPEDNRAFTTAGTACMRLEQYDKAVRFFERQVELTGDDPTAHGNLADALWQAGRLSDAESACRKALELDANGSSPLFILGRVHQKRNQKEEAIRYFQQFLEMVPEGEYAEQAREALEELQG